MSDLFALFKDRLKGKAVPAFIRGSGNRQEILSAANVYTMALDKAKKLRSMGFTQGDTLLEVPEDLTVLAHFLACLKLGISYCPVNESVFNQIKDNQIDGLQFNEGKLIRDLDYLPGTESYAILLFTSGTTRQKLVGVKESHILFQLESHREALADLKAESRLSVLPKFHCFGMILDLFLGVLQSNYIYFLGSGEFRKARLEQLLTTESINLICGVPKHLDLLIQYSERSSLIFEKMKEMSFFVGGAALREEQRLSAQSRFQRLIIGYGLTEAGPGVLIDGKPIPGVSVEIRQNKLLVTSPSICDFEGKNDDEVLVVEDIGVKKKGLVKIFGRSDRFLKDSKGVMLHYSEVQKDIFLKYGAIVNFEKIDQKVAMVEIIGSEPVLTESNRREILNLFPSICGIKNIEKEKILDILEKTRVKSSDDIFRENNREILEERRNG